MSKNTIVLSIGTLLILMPFLGFPRSWKTIFYVLAGFILIYVALAVHIRRKTKRVQRNKIENEGYQETYVQNNSSDDNVITPFYDENQSDRSSHPKQKNAQLIRGTHQ